MSFAVSNNANSLVIANMDNFYAPTQIVNTAFTTFPFYNINDLGALPTLMNESLKTQTFGELVKNIADMPVPSIPLVYVNDTPKQSNIKNDSDIKKSVIKYYYYKLLEKWIYNDMIGILAFVNVNKEGVPSFIKSTENFSIANTSKESKDILDTKINFIKNSFFDKNFVKKILKKIIEKNNITWYDLYDYESNVQKNLYLKTLKYLKSKLDN
jgi:hypothetical protein